MKQRQKISGGNTLNEYQHFSDSDDNDVDSVPLLPIRNSYVDGERISPTRRVHRNTGFERSDNYVNVPIRRPVLEAQVQETDTLQAIALRFHCSVEELKRLNNIHRENEIFAHNILKVPITPQSILLGTLPKVHQLSGSSSPKTTSPKNEVNNVLLNPQELNEKLLIAQPNGGSWSHDLANVDLLEPGNETVNDVIFNSTVVPSERSNESNNDYEPVNNVKTLQPVLNLNGSDCGVKWYHLLGVILILAVIIPIIYVYHEYQVHLEEEKKHLGQMSHI